jgi:hypothetical protein
VSFAAFTDRDFDAFLEKKWRSNVFNRERLEVKQKLLGLGKLLSPDLVTEDGPLELEASAEHPALWNHGRVPNQILFFSRSKEARRVIETLLAKRRTIANQIDDPSPLRNHIFLSVMVDQRGVEIALKLHADATIDRENLERKCEDYFVREQLLGHLRTLDPLHTIGIEGQSEVGIGSLSDEKLQEILRAIPSSGSWFTVRTTLGREDEQSRSESFAALARERLLALLPILRFIAWRRENDFTEVQVVLKKQEFTQRSKGLIKNDAIRVVQGMFTGRTGVVQEIDSKGAIKVRLGTLVVKVSGDEVVKV